MERNLNESERKLLSSSSSSSSSSSFSEGHDIHQPHSKRHRISYTKIIAITSTLLLAIILITHLSWPLLHTRPKLNWTTCGNSSAEARKNGCHYEPMQRSWIPDACYFNEPSNEYHPFEDREWFSDENLTLPLSPTEMQKLHNGDDLIAYTWSFHHEHCIYCWRKLAIAVERALPMIDTKSADFHHSTHCAGWLGDLIYSVAEDRWVNHVEYTVSPLMFQGCVELGWR